MKKTFPFLMLIIAVIFTGACTKKSDSTTAVSNKLVYTVNGLSDINLRQYVDTTILVAVAVTYESGTQEAVTISLGALPAGITATTPTSISGTPSFGFTFSLHSIAANAGTYPVTVTATTASGVQKTLSFNLIVSVNPNATCAGTVTDVPAIYTAVTACTPSSLSTYFPQGTVEVYTGADEQLYLPSPGIATLNCANGTLTTSENVNSGLAISAGTGTFTTTTIIVNYSVSGSLNGTCTSTYTR